MRTVLEMGHIFKGAERKSALQKKKKKNWISIKRQITHSKDNYEVQKACGILLRVRKR